METMQRVENTSGIASAFPVPTEIKRWNWGAFLLNWIWGLGNNTYIALLCFVPILNIIMPFVLGVKGNEWAWRNKRWESVEHFKRVQRKWAFAGLIVLLVVIVLSAVFAFSVFTMVRHSDIYELSLNSVRNNGEARDALGMPINPGWWFSGNIHVDGMSGSASFSFPVSGPEGKGTVYVEAVKDMGKWHVKRLVVEIAATGARISIVPVSET
jgi:hypothetical protein